jgi:L-amino acid N-acyltransferase YncA
MISIRPADARDSADILSWRNDPQARRASESTDRISLKEHEEWLALLLSSHYRVIFIAVDSELGESVGMCRFDPMPNGVVEVSINIRAGSQGQGVGQAVLNAAIQEFRSGHSAYQVLLAKIRRSNAASARLFMKSGFEIFKHDGAFTYYRLGNNVPDVRTGPS